MRPDESWMIPYVGIPYVSGGQSREGSDCWGLFNLLWREHMGAALPPYEGPLWTRGADACAVGDAADAYAALFDPVAPGEEIIGDGVLFRMGRHPLHLGFVLAPGWMLHVEEACSSVIENYRIRPWTYRVLGIYRYLSDAGASR